LFVGDVIDDGVYDRCGKTSDSGRSPSRRVFAVFDRTMPEEVNRLVTDALAELLFTTSRDADENLLKEGVDRKKIHFVGNVMIDTLLKHRQRPPHCG